MIFPDLLKCVSHIFISCDVPMTAKLGEGGGGLRP